MMPISCNSRGQEQEAGFTLVSLVVTIFLVLLVLSIAAPRVAMQLKREREVEAQHRGNEYVRAIQLYYRKFQHYPTSLDQLENTNNQKFLRQRYADPLTGKADWRLIHVGENKTTVKGFFGQDLPGIGAGLGIASGGSSSGGSTGASGLGGSSFSSGSGSALGSSTSSFGSGTGGIGAPSSSSGFGSSGTSGIGGSGAPDAGAGSGGTGSSGSGSGSSSGFGTSVGPIMGVGVAKSGMAFVAVNQKSNYQDWEFLYDPRIEQLKANVSIFGGGIATGGSSSGLGSTPASNGISGFGSTPGQPASGATPGTGTPGTTGTTTPP
jgi:type II secretory pathway pseudopilin PulG